METLVILLMFIFTVAFTIEAKALGFGLSGIGYDKRPNAGKYESIRCSISRPLDVGYPIICGRAGFMTAQKKSRCQCSDSLTHYVN